jgi:TetR/AcrR family transcriptional regulator, transcriptional repressor for nem operon
MRYKPDHKVESRSKILAAVGRGFRKKGYAGIGVDGLAKEAEVTSGAFYGHFRSKDDAFRQALMAGMKELEEGIAFVRQEEGEHWIEAFLDFYLGYRRTCNLEESCASQSMTADVGRADEETKAIYEEQMQNAIKAIADGLPIGTEEDRISRAGALIAVVSGGVSIARAMKNRASSDAIAAAVKVAALKIIYA